MATLKVLHVTTGPASDPDIDLIKGLSFNAPRGSFTGSGDNAIAIHVGRAGPVTGTIMVEDATCAEAAIAAAVSATCAFTCASANAEAVGTCTVTFTQLVCTGTGLTVGDGVAVGSDVPVYSIPFVAATVVVAAV